MNFPSWVRLVKFTFSRTSPSLRTAALRPKPYHSATRPNQGISMTSGRVPKGIEPSKGKAGESQGCPSDGRAISESAGKKLIPQRSQRPPKHHNSIHRTKLTNGALPDSGRDWHRVRPASCEYSPSIFKEQIYRPRDLKPGGGTNAVQWSNAGILIGSPKRFTLDQL